MPVRGMSLNLAIPALAERRICRLIPSNIRRIGADRRAGIDAKGAPPNLDPISLGQPANQAVEPLFIERVRATKLGLEAKSAGGPENFERECLCHLDQGPCCAF